MELKKKIEKKNKTKQKKDETKCNLQLTTPEIP